MMHFEMDNVGKSRLLAIKCQYADKCSFVDTKECVDNVCGCVLYSLK